MADDYVTISATGDGVFCATAGEPSEFVVHASECQENVTCGLLVAFDGPEKPDIEFDHLKDGDISVRYFPTVPGLYHLVLKYNKKHVRGSPFTINIDGHGSPIPTSFVPKRNIVKKVKMTGPGMQIGHVNEIGEIYLDISHAELNIKRELMVDIDGPMEPMYSLVENDNGIITLTYVPTKKGNYRFMIRFHFEHVNGSPFTVPVV